MVSEHLQIRQTWILQVPGGGVCVKDEAEQGAGVFQRKADFFLPLSENL